MFCFYVLYCMSGDEAVRVDLQWFWDHDSKLWAKSDHNPHHWERNAAEVISSTGCQSLHPPSPFIVITQPESWYSFYRSTEGRRLSRPDWLVNYQDGLPAHRQSLFLIITGSDVAQLRWSSPTRCHWAKPPTIKPNRQMSGLVTYCNTR